MLGENIKKYRDLKGISQQELALKVNVVRQTVSKWEKGLSVPDSETLLKIAQALEIPVYLLLCEASPIKEDEEQEKIKSLESKIEAISADLTREKEVKRKRLRLVSVIIVLVSLIFLFSEIGQAIYPLIQKTVFEIFSDTAYIGGCDKPTRIYIESGSLNILKTVIFTVTALFAGFGIYKTKKGKKYEKN